MTKALSGARVIQRPWRVEGDRGPSDEGRSQMIWGIISAPDAQAPETIAYPIDARLCARASGLWH